jgi:hypothetical protein
MASGKNNREAKPGHKWLAIGLGAGALLLFSCSICGGGAWLYYKLTVPPNIVGRWAATFGDEVYEFRADGTGQLKTKLAGVYPFTYRFVSYSDLTLTFPRPAKDAQLRMDELRYRVAYFSDTMQWEDLNDPGFYVKWRRIK